MSVFKVHLNYPGKQGYLDFNPATASPGFLGNQMQPSKQRTMFCAGPNRIYRELFDGQVFTDCNYWKRFAYPQVPQEVAFIEVLTDDGSIYSDIPGENTFPKVFYPYSVLIADTFATNFIDILGTYGAAATFVQITNLGTAATQNITVQLNGDVDAVMLLAFGDTQVFNAGDLAVTKLGFDGGTADTTLQIVLSLTVQCNS
jgi:hypothetical protein